MARELCDAAVAWGEVVSDAGVVAVAVAVAVVVEVVVVVVMLVMAVSALPVPVILTKSKEVLSMLYDVFVVVVGTASPRLACSGFRGGMVPNTLICEP